MIDPQTVTEKLIYLLHSKIGHMCKHMCAISIFKDLHAQVLIGHIMSCHNNFFVVVYKMHMSTIAQQSKSEQPHWTN